MFQFGAAFEIFIPFSSFKNNSNISKHPQTIMLSNKALQKNVPQTLLRYVFASASLRYKRYSTILKILNQRKTPSRRLGLCPAKNSSQNTVWEKQKKNELTNIFASPCNGTNFYASRFLPTKINNHKKTETGGQRFSFLEKSCAVLFHAKSTNSCPYVEHAQEMFSSKRAKQTGITIRYLISKHTAEGNQRAPKRA